ncbi:MULTISPECIES: hypothetical protein [unclassified Colwellia]|uniref:hypothetical protein n=1 Tax=unclassified Colwellia TaxID=196834 RepID=UPI0015F68C46|nr:MULTISPECIES: hypothetical protein [unclassified Colwellia]MBA6230633.1 hypothetical protein [Colwellia sp. MB02u-7]MBA6234564.1 hypothetical protein [Colwellia sp. MB02u-11]MBA6255428.1 hypothetical protein [Colwellia sp. MB3u-28]MBA6261568.1 hypothetical protein [Colwellia sp. MB3u-41]MBA6301118.1 hypothetical protein [Colwellia sp. MB3u-22]
MNKFAPIAFVLLLSCGAALWFLASDSLNFHIKNQLQNIGSQLSQQNVNVENVTMRGYQSSGTITNLVFSPSQPTNFKASTQPTVSIASIDLVIDRDTLSEDVIIIDSITINGLNALFHINRESLNAETLLSTVQKNIPQLIMATSVIEDEQQGKVTLPLLQITKVIVNAGVLQIVNNENGQTITKILPRFELVTAHKETASQGQTIGVEIFEQLLIFLNNQAGKLQITKTL